MAAMDPRFTHGQLVGALVESLGLTPDMFGAAATLRPPSRSQGDLSSAVPSWAMPASRWAYPEHDRDHIPSSESSLLGLDAGHSHQPPKPRAPYSISSGTSFRGTGYAEVLEWMQATPAAYPPPKRLASSTRTREAPPSISVLTAKQAHSSGDSRSPTSYTSASISNSTPPPPHPPLPPPAAAAVAAPPNPSPSTSTGPHLGPCSKVWELPPVRQAALACRDNQLTRAAHPTQEKGKARVSNTSQAEA